MLQKYPNVLKFALAKNQKSIKKMPNRNDIEWRALYRMLSGKKE
jgi:hypothetical protein